LGDSTEGGRALGHHVDEMTKPVGDVIEQFVEAHELGTADIPVSMLGLQREIERAREAGVE
jgi:hypothetical protein